MKKLVLLKFIFISVISVAQYSTKTEKKKPTQILQVNDGQTFKLNSIQEVVQKTNSEIELKFDNTKTLEKIIDDATKLLDKKRDSILKASDLTIAEKNNQILNLNAAIDSLNNYKKEQKNLEKFVARQKNIENGNVRLFSKSALESEYFYEGNEDVNKLFKNNRITYSPSLGTMSITSEAVNDYLGPIRLGLSFTIAAKKLDSSKNDSTKKTVKQANTASQLQNGGGDVSINLHYPIWGTRNGNSSFALKISTYYNAGFTLPVFGSPSNEFILTHDLGTDIFASINGSKNNIHFYGLFKTGYIFGNEDFRIAITKDKPENPKDFFIGQISAGLDFDDGYRFQFDYYWGSSFVNNTFPASLTFIIRPK